MRLPGGLLYPRSEVTRLAAAAVLWGVYILMVLLLVIALSVN